jgi:hypothetical protein
VKENGFAYLILLLVVGTTLTGGYFLYKKLYSENYNTYSNATLGLSVKYPSNWNIKEIDDGQSQEIYKRNTQFFLNPNNYQKQYDGDNVVILEYFYNPNNLSVMNYEAELQESNFQESSILYYPDAQRIDSSQEAEVYFIKEYHCVTICRAYVIKHNKYIFLLRKFDRNVQDIDKIFDEILSSIRFAN